MGKKTLAFDAGLVLFSGVPFLYSWVNTPEELFVLRLLHGLATAVFGPVTLAFVLEMAVSGRAERLGWFGMARTGSYLLAPLLGAWLLTWMDPAAVFTLIGFHELPRLFTRMHDGFLTPIA